MVTIDDLLVLWDARDKVKHGFYDAFCVNSPVPRIRIKKFLIDSGFFAYECAFCHINEWSGTKLSLELDHINGINDDNRLDNLRLLCPNCHSMTSTYSNKRGKQTQNNPVSDGDLIQAIQQTPNIRQTLIHLGLQPFGGNYDRVKRLKRDCRLTQPNVSITSNIPERSELIDILVECGLISVIAKKYGVNSRTVRVWLAKYNLPATEKSIREYLKTNFVEYIDAVDTGKKISKIPSKDDLLNVIRVNPVITTVAGTFGVSDNAVRKWMCKYGIPTRMRELHEYLGGAYDRKIKLCESHVRGTRVGNSKLTESDVMTIRSLYATGNHSHRSLAVQFGVGHRAIGDILSNKTWVHVAPMV